MSLKDIKTKSHQSKPQARSRPRRHSLWTCFRVSLKKTRFRLFPKEHAGRTDKLQLFQYLLKCLEGIDCLFMRKEHMHRVKPSQCQPGSNHPLHLVGPPSMTVAVTPYPEVWGQPRHVLCEHLQETVMNEGVSRMALCAACQAWP